MLTIMPPPDPNPDDVLRRMLATKPQPKPVKPAESKKARAKPTKSKS